MDDILRVAPDIPPDSPPELRTLLDALTTLQPMLQRSECHIVFWGTFKSGKSTLINALLGSDIMPMRVLRATGITTHVAYAPQPSASLMHTHSADGTTHLEPVTFDERARYILLDLHAPPSTDTAPEPDSLPEPHYEAVHIGLPLPLLQRRCTLLDTPGLMDDMALSQRTYQALKQADLAVMVLSAYQLLSHREKEAARMVHTMLDGNIVFIINQMDMVATEERDAVLERAHTILQGVGNPLVGAPRIFGMEALPALAARKHNRRDDPALQALLVFEEWLMQLLDDPDWEEAVLRSRHGRLAKVVARLREVATTCASEAQAHLSALRQREAETHARQYAMFKQHSAEDRLRLDKLKSRLEWHGAAFVQACVTHAERIIESEEQWQDRLTDSFYLGVQEYLHRINRGIAAALAQTGLRPPPFTLSQTESHPAHLAAQAWLEQVGFWLDVLGDVPLAPTRQHSGIPVFDMVDDFVGQILLTMKPMITESLVQAAHSVQPTLYAAAAQHIDQVSALLIEREHSYQPVPPVSPHMSAAHHTVERYTSIVQWCDALHQALDHDHYSDHAGRQR